MSARPKVARPTVNTKLPHNDRFIRTSIDKNRFSTRTGPHRPKACQTQSDAATSWVGQHGRNQGRSPEHHKPAVLLAAWHGQNGRNGLGGQRGRSGRMGSANVGAREVDAHGARRVLAFTCDSRGLSPPAMHPVRFLAADWATVLLQHLAGQSQLFPYRIQAPSGLARHMPCFAGHPKSVTASFFARPLTQHGHLLLFTRVNCHESATQDNDAG